eukprot:PhM_4_TR3081/c1_g1_i2/m.53909
MQAIVDLAPAGNCTVIAPDAIRRAAGDAPFGDVVNLTAAEGSAVLAPLNVHNDHWVLLTISRKAITVYDSMPGHTAGAGHKFAQFLIGKLPKAFVGTRVQTGQSDAQAARSNDCALFVMCNALRYMVTVRTRTLNSTSGIATSRVAPPEPGPGRRRCQDPGEPHEVAQGAVDGDVRERQAQGAPRPAGGRFSMRGLRRRLHGGTGHANLLCLQARMAHSVPSQRSAPSGEQRQGLEVSDLRHAGTEGELCAVHVGPEGHDGAVWPRYTAQIRCHVRRVQPQVLRRALKGPRHVRVAVQRVRRQAEASRGRLRLPPLLEGRRQGRPQDRMAVQLLQGVFSCFAYGRQAAQGQRLGIQFVPNWPPPLQSRPQSN